MLQRVMWMNIIIQLKVIYIIHLGMSGSIVIERNKFKPFQKHDHIAIEFIEKNNSKIRFILRSTTTFGFFNI